MSDQFSPLAIAEKHFDAGAMKRSPSRRELYSAIDMLSSELKSVRARLEAMEAHGVKYAGVWQRSLSYRRGLVVTAHKGIWVALKDTAEGVEPGKSPEHWQLAVKGEKT